MGASPPQCYLTADFFWKETSSIRWIFPNHRSLYCLRKVYIYWEGQNETGLQRWVLCLGNRATANLAQAGHAFCGGSSLNSARNLCLSRIMEVGYSHNSDKLNGLIFFRWTPLCYVKCIRHNVQCARLTKHLDKT